MWPDRGPKRSLEYSFTEDISRSKYLHSGEKTQALNTFENNVKKIDDYSNKKTRISINPESALPILEHLESQEVNELEMNMPSLDFDNLSTISEFSFHKHVEGNTKAAKISQDLSLEPISADIIETKSRGDVFFDSEPLKIESVTHSDILVGEDQNLVNNSETQKSELGEYNKEKDEKNIEDQILREVCPKLISDIYLAGYPNFHEVLIGALRICPESFSVDDFYNLLYNADFPNDVVSNPIDGSKIDKTQYTKSNSQGLRYCFFILEAFKRREMFSGVHTSTSNCEIVSYSSPLKVHDILRVFLAIKIIYVLAKPVKEALPTKQSLERISIYKAYYIICHKLISKYPTKANSLRLQKNLVLSQSQIGKLIKSVYQGVTEKRLGKRGHSKYHYLGMSWNKNLVDEEIMGMFEIDLPELKQLFSSTQVLSQDYKLLPVQGQVESSSKFDSDKPPSILYGTSSSSLKKPKYTFVDFSSKFVESCSPRVWQFATGLRPQQSEWSKQTIQNSKDALKHFGLSFAFLSCDLYSVATHNPFLDEIAHVLRHLIKLEASVESFRHLYLLLQVLIFPIVISSEDEVPAWNKGQFQAFLNKAVAQLEPFVESVPNTHKNDLIIVIKILRRMNYFHSMIRSRIKTSVLVNTLGEIVEDLTQLADVQPTLSSEATKVGQIIIQAVMSAIRAFDVKLITPEIEAGSAMEIQIVLKIASAFKKLLEEETKFVQDSISQLTNKTFEKPDLNFVFEMFIKSSGYFHASVLLEPAVSKLPMPVMTYIIVQIMNEIQMVSFHSFSKRKKEVSQETFKLWWVYSMVVQEYFSIISEIASLSQKLALPKEEVSAQ